MLATFRSLATPATRERVYVVAVAGVTLLASLGFVTGAVVAPLIGLIGALLTLVWAAAQKSPTVRTAIYAVLAPLQALLQLYGFLNDVQWASISGLVAAVLGIALAGSKAQTPNQVA